MEGICRVFSKGILPGFEPISTYGIPGDAVFHVFGGGATERYTGSFVPHAGELGVAGFLAGCRRRNGQIDILDPALGRNIMKLNRQADHCPGIVFIGFGNTHRFPVDIARDGRCIFVCVTEFLSVCCFYPNGCFISIAFLEFFSGFQEASAVDLFPVNRMDRIAIAEDRAIVGRSPLCHR